MAKKKRSYQTPWFTEKELGDKLWENRSEHFELVEGWRAYREVQIGNGRIDFVTFSDKHVDLWELKITATVDSVIQIAKYQRDFHEYLRQIFYAGEFSNSNCPKFASHIIARYFDSKIVELCAEFNITLWRLDVTPDGAVDMDLECDNEFPIVPDHCEIVDLVMKHCKPEVRSV